MDFSGDDFYDDEVTSGPIDDGRYDTGEHDEDTIFDTFGDEADPFGE